MVTLLMLSKLYLNAERVLLMETLNQQSVYCSVFYVFHIYYSNKFKSSLAIKVESRTHTHKINVIVDTSIARCMLIFFSALTDSALLSFMAGQFITYPQHTKQKRVLPYFVSIVFGIYAFALFCLIGISYASRSF